MYCVISVIISSIFVDVLWKEQLPTHETNGGFRMVFSIIHIVTVGQSRRSATQSSRRILPEKDKDRTR